MKFKRLDRSYLILFTVFLLIEFILISVVKPLNYWHNDDPVYYDNISRILSGNFELNPLTAPSFYSIGILSALYSRFFGMESLHCLTVAVSVASVYILAIIFYKFFHRTLLESVLFSLLLLFNPIFVFGMMGFMTDNYFIFFLVISFFFILDYLEKSSDKKSGNVSLFLLANVFIVLSYLARQLGLITSLAFSIILFTKKIYKFGITQCVFFTLLVIYHFWFFPKNGEMPENSFVFSNLTYFRHLFTITDTILIYVSAFLIPIVALFIFKNTRRLKQNYKLVILVLSFVTLLVFDRYFNPLGFVNERFFYLKHAVHRRGFFVESINGSKYNFYFSGILYAIWDFMSRFLLAMALWVVLFRKKYKSYINIFFIYSAIYMFIMNLSLKMYDRYVLPVIVSSLLFLVSVVGSVPRFWKILLIIFVLGLGYFSYNFALDYALSHNYVWNKAIELSEVEKIPRNRIKVSIAWEYLYPPTKEGFTYKFSYNSPQYQDNISYTLSDVYKVKFPLSFWNNPKIYLYRKL